jgi:hypothetical protein
MLGLYWLHQIFIKDPQHIHTAYLIIFCSQVSSKFSVTGKGDKKMSLSQFLGTLVFAYSDTLLLYSAEL